MEQFISIKQGDADTFTETIEGLTTLTGYTAKMYIFKSDGTKLDTINGTINGLIVTYEIVNESSKIYPVGTYDFETKIFDASDHVYSQSNGIFEVRSTNEEDPS